MAIFELAAVICLVTLAVGDLIVGVANDAVNFLNSAIGAKVASRKVIFIVASIGIIIGATFSDGIIEIARKGIFHPSFFTAQEAIIIFTAVAFADIILLDLFSTFGLPTSTTVSVIFELLGASLVLAILKLGDVESAWQMINSSSVIKIIMGIISSIGVAFFGGLIVQFLTRIFFTFNYQKTLKKWGFLWSAIALTSLMFFILLKGGQHATFITSTQKIWINSHTYLILSASLVFFSFLSYLLIKFKADILKIIILIGTGSLAMAFAGNDLANFIGVSVAGVYAYLGADLSGSLPTPTLVLLSAGLIMAFTIFTSKKARTVTQTEINLSSHHKHVKHAWKTNLFIDKLCNLILFLFKIFTFPIPARLKKWIRGRLDHSKLKQKDNEAFDLLRASVNLMLAAAIISYATSKKLPLSTTYVTFIVAMGTALADGAWKRDCAPHRIAGVLTVITGWFITAIIALLMSGIAVGALYYIQFYGLALLIVVMGLSIYKLHTIHRKSSARELKS